MIRTIFKAIVIDMHPNLFFNCIKSLLWSTKPEGDQPHLRLQGYHSPVLMAVSPPSSSRGGMGGDEEGL